LLIGEIDFGIGIIARARLLLTFSALVILVSADASKAGLIMATRDVSASVDPATVTDESNQTTEDQIGLDKGKRRDVQRRLNRLGFATKATGKFDENTRAAISHWQAAHDYSTTGFLNTRLRTTPPKRSIIARRRWLSH
jgi:peptidoglycan hydrolase-like protein with peptidoglycan-binding domain